jgi:hypothetical protein
MEDKVVNDKDHNKTRDKTKKGEESLAKREERIVKNMVLIGICCGSLTIGMVLVFVFVMQSFTGVLCLICYL